MRNMLRVQATSLKNETRAWFLSTFSLFRYKVGKYMRSKQKV